MARYKSGKRKGMYKPKRTKRASFMRIKKATGMKVHKKPNKKGHYFY